MLNNYQGKIIRVSYLIYLFVTNTFLLITASTVYAGHDCLILRGGDHCPQLPGGRFGKIVKLQPEGTRSKKLP